MTEGVFFIPISTSIPEWFIWWILIVGIVSGLGIMSIVVYLTTK